MNKMKKYFFLLLILAGSTFLASAQTMTAAKKIPPMLSREGVINATADEVWKLISVLDRVAEYNGAMVASVEKEGDGYEAYRLCKMVDGTERGEEITVFAKSSKQICFCTEDSQYPVERFVVNYYIKPSGKSKCKLSLEAYFTVNKGAGKTKTYKAIGKELSTTLKGIQNFFNK